MSKGVKILLWIVVIIAVLAIIGFIWAKNAFDKISFSVPRLQGLDMQGLTLNDLAKIALEGGQKELKVSLAMDAKNENNFSIPFGNMLVKMYYGSTLIASTSPSLENKKFVLPAKGSVTVSDTINIILNTAGAKLLIEKLKGGHPQINYSIGLRVFGIPIPSIKNSFAW